MTPPTGAQHQQDDDNPLMYKVKDSRSGFDGGYYHVVDCPQGYKAISGGFNLNQRTGLDAKWIILKSRPGGNDGQSWVTAANWTSFARAKKTDLKPTNFQGFAVCVPQDLLPKVDYAFEEHTVKNATSGSLGTFWPQCKANERVLGGGFDLLHKTQVNLVRTERGDDGRSWGLGVWIPGEQKGTREYEVRSYRVCVPAGALKDLDYKSARNTQKDRAAAFTPSCTEGTYLLSGGAGMPNEDKRKRWSRIAPATPPRTKPSRTTGGKRRVPQTRGGADGHGLFVCAVRQTKRPASRW